MLLLPETDRIFELCATLELIVEFCVPAAPVPLVGTNVKIVGAGEAETD